MATKAADIAVGADDRREKVTYLDRERGFKNWAKSWFLTLDHKRIGLMYLLLILTFFFIAGVLALLVRLELFTPTLDLLTKGGEEASAAGARGNADLYNQVFTLHGSIMVFLFIIPSVPAALGNFVLPLMLGAKDVAFPRLNLMSWYVYVLGACVLVSSILFGGLDTGWTFYTPYSTSTSTAVILAVLGAFILGFSSILTGLNFIVTIHKMRAPGMTWYRMPLFAWGIYATALIQVLATPVLAITLLLLVMERTFGIGIFDPALGGDPVLFQHFFWFYSHPAVYIMIVPGFGIMSELISVHSRKHIFGYKAIALSSVAIAVIGFLVWGHHMFVAGQSELAAAVFSFLTFFVAVPTAIKVFSWVATLYKGSIQLNTPMLYALSFLFLFTIGGLTGLFLGTLATDVHLHDTYFVVAHFHYVMMGGTVIAFLGGLFHWWPKIFGKMFSDFWGKISVALVFVGFNLTFFTQFLLGSKGMPRRYGSYNWCEQLPTDASQAATDRCTELISQLGHLHKLSTIGSFILATGLLVAGVTLFHAMIWGKKSPKNPWRGKSLEWATETPPIPHNFASQPTVDSDPYEYEEIDYSSGKAH
jgi:cytochrome c oxidase subunit 1